MGYDIDRFVGYVNEGLLCSICRGVLEDPLQAPCEHAFCTACIHVWLVHHSNCPEDRQMVDVSLLRPLYRYMKNDLNRLQLRCKNREHGCEMICFLESIDRHERECEYSQIPCSNAGCTVYVERRNLERHLAVCSYRSRERPNGCGYAILSSEDRQRNCVAQLRTELDLLRSEVICRVKEAKHELESMLDSQRRHMVQKESILQNEIEELKSKMSQMMIDIRALMATEREHRQELEQAKVEKRELMELLRGLQKDCRGTTTEGSRKQTNFSPLTRLESAKRKPREVTVI